MTSLTDHGQTVQRELCAKYGLSPDAVQQMMQAVSWGGGTQAQFSVPELGGMGQWSQGGMTMVGDMFNHGLQATVAGLCADIAAAMNSGALFRATGQQQDQGGNWWPEDLGRPASQGAQNDMAYAIFPQARRLALRRGGRVTIHDTGNHAIGGVGQQQSGSSSVSFSSQYGPVPLSDLPEVTTNAAQGTPARDDRADVPSQAASEQPEPAQTTAADSAPGPVHPFPATPPASRAQPASQSGGTAPQRGGPAASMSSDEVFSALEKLGALRKADILTEEEFAAKKSELLSRL